MASRIVDLFKIDEESGSSIQNQDVEMEDEDEGESLIDAEDQQKKTEGLKSALPSLAGLWWADSVQLDVVAEKMADASRDRKSRFLLLLFIAFHPFRHVLQFLFIS